MVIRSGPKLMGGASNNDYAEAVEQTSDGGYIVAGYTTSFGAGIQDVYLIKTDSLGDTLWTRTYGGGSSDLARAVQQTTDGGYIVVGETISFGAGSYDVYLIKTNSNGDTLWTRTYGGGTWDFGYAVEQTTDGGYIVTGYTRSFGAGLDDVYLIKTDSLGNMLWTKTYGGADFDHGYAVRQTTDSGYMVAGYTNSFGAGSYDVYLIKTNANGDTLWTKTYGGGGWDEAYAVRQTTDGGYIVAGYAGSFGAGAGDVYLIKTDANGNSGCNEMGTATIVLSGGIVGTPATIVGSGGASVNSTATVVSSPPTIYSILCMTMDTIAADFTADDTSICKGACINFTDLSTGFPTSWQWLFPGAIPSSDTVQNPTNICYDTAGFYDVKLIATNAIGSDTLIKISYIQVDTCPPPPQPTANFTASDTVTCEDSCINFTNLSINAVSWQWSFPGAVPSTSTSQNPTNICYNDTGVFDVQLIATNQLLSIRPVFLSTNHEQLTTNYLIKVTFPFRYILLSSKNSTSAYQANTAGFNFLSL